MSAPMFARSICAGDPCQACALAGRRLPNGIPIRKELLDVGMNGCVADFPQACPICDQTPAEAPDHTTRRNT